MPAYCIFDNIEVQDIAKLEEYKNLVEPVVEKHEGRYVVLGGKMIPVEGSWKPTYVVIIEFPSFEKANEWYFSEDYQPLKALRQSGVKGDAIILQGLD